VIDPSLPLQKAVHDALTAAAGDDFGVYDRVPVDPAGKISARFPFVHIGEDHVLSEADQCHDAASAFATVHVLSRAVGKVEAKAIMARVLLALDVILVVEGFQVITHQVADGPRHMTDPDGLTSHSVATVRYRMAPTA
jgi:hypothetical protein